jgi:hypothetical protein
VRQVGDLGFLGVMVGVDVHYKEKWVSWKSGSSLQRMESVLWKAWRSVSDFG